MKFDCDSSEDNFDEIDWAPIEATIADRRPSAVPFDWRIRVDIVDQLREYKRRTVIRNEGVTKARVFKECDAIAEPAFELENALRDQYGENGGYYLVDQDGLPTEESISVKKIINILESIAVQEQGYARLIDKSHEVDPAPPRKRLGIAMFFLGEREFKLSPKRTTPTDREIAVPSGDLFKFVAAVLRLVDEDIKPTTLEQWSRDAQVWKREAEEEEQARKVARAELFAQIHGVDCPVPDENAGLGLTYIVDGDPLPFLRGRPQRDWLWLDQDDERDRDWLFLNEDDD